MRTQPERLPLLPENAKKIGAAGACNTTSAPDETPWMRRRNALIPFTAIHGFWQPVSGCAP